MVSTPHAKLAPKATESVHIPSLALPQRRQSGLNLLQASNKRGMWRARRESGRLKILDEETAPEQEKML